MTCTAKKKLENIQIKSFDHRIVTLEKKNLTKAQKREKPTNISILASMGIKF